MSAVTVLGLVAAALTTGAYIPQVVKTWRSGSSADLSMGTYAILLAGLVAWLAYGIAVDDLPIILANAVTIVLVGAVLAHVLLSRRRAAARRRAP
ncbi:SemiSWEET transporter [Rubrivirga sp. S365]|uniref:SemiSWEET family sugar transporter n=1 Tax=Rubrivirga sp. S365 TaxID=3076080 RepID=UPI0028C8BA96|nr:SemiSWEET transporter [Rubrivirga sp. S365]MDT7857625.1 SemiSWEET transporter [Rubrivirga sp. S365]